MEKKSKLTKEQIVNTALSLMRYKTELRTVNMREIARSLGCAHTNIYNYFPSYTDLLWETHTAILNLFIDILDEKICAADNAELKLNCYFDAFVQIYFDNKGWFRLVWLEYIGEERPKSNEDAAQRVQLRLNRIITDICSELKAFTVNTELVNRVIHNTHCYIVGEVSNYISGRGLIKNEGELKKYIIKEATNILTCCISPVALVRSELFGI